MDAPLLRQDRRLSVPTFRPPTRRFTNPPTRRSAASAGMSRRLGQPALGRLKVKFKARRARRASRLRVKRVRRLFEARRFAPSSGRGAPKPAQKRRDARVEETRRESYRVGQPYAKTQPKGAKPVPFSLGWAALQKDAATIPDKSLSGRFGPPLRWASAQPRRAGRIGLRAKPPRGSDPHACGSAPSCPAPVAPRIRASAGR